MFKSLVGGELFEMMSQQEGNRICNAIGDALQKEYGGYRWHVSVNLDSGIANVSLPAISDEYAMAIHLNKHVFGLETAAKNSGGEYLERFGLSRSRNDGSVNSLPRDVKGNVMLAKEMANG